MKKWVGIAFNGNIVWSRMCQEMTAFLMGGEGNQSDPICFCFYCGVLTLKAVLQMRKLTRRHALANQFVLRIFCTVLGSMDSTWINHKFRDDLVDFRLIFISIEPKMMYP